MLKTLLFTLFAALAAPVHAQSNGLPVSGELLPGWRTKDGHHVAGLAIRLAPGWKTYWRAPGEGGIPPRFNWSGSTNLASVEVHYPVPKVMDQLGIPVIGYDSDVVFPLIVTARDRRQPVTIRAEIELGVCEEVCIPVALQLRGDLPVPGGPDPEISASLQSKPDQGGHMTCRIEPIADGLTLTAIISEPSLNAEAAVIEAGDSDLWISPATVSRSGGKFAATVELVPPTAQPFALARDSVRMTLIGHGRAVEFLGCR